MTPAFWDTSALVPLCVQQQPGPAVQQLLQQYEIVVWWATSVEMRSAFERLPRMGQCLGTRHSRTAARKAATRLARTAAQRRAPSAGRGLLKGLHPQSRGFATACRRVDLLRRETAEPDRYLGRRSASRSGPAGGIPSGSCLNRIYRPTMLIPASSASLTIDGRSNSSVRPASTHRHVAPAAHIASIVATPTTGTSNRMS